ncbi:hypothetical protein D3C72_2138710 [compost metagenome]
MTLSLRRSSEEENAIISEEVLKPSALIEAIAVVPFLKTKPRLVPCAIEKYIL